MLKVERGLWQNGVQLVCGVDEVGRGPLAGPVVAAAVILPKHVELKGVRDSKALTPQKREELYPQILESCISFGIGQVDPMVIDEVNILQATFIAMRRALSKLRVVPQHILVDGCLIPRLPLLQTPIKGGDRKSLSIASASILAKVFRDRLMECYDLRYPQYKFSKNKGYGTREHVEAIFKYGPCEIHRKSFRPLKEYLNEGI